MNEFKLLSVIDPSIKLNARMVSALNAVKNVLSWYELLYIEEETMKGSVPATAVAGLLYLAKNKENKIREILNAKPTEEIIVSFIVTQDDYRITAKKSGSHEEVDISDEIIPNRIIVKDNNCPQCKTKVQVSLPFEWK